MTANLKVALGSIFTECNHLGGQATDLACFERCELRRGPQVMQQTASTVGGMIQALRDCQVDIAPLLVASAVPGGPITSTCYRGLKQELLDRLRSSLPVNGVLLALHGSATVEDVGDPEGDLLHAVRELVGPGIPIVATLDLHAHVTASMVRHADALVAWETYPHRDAFTTGERGARLLCDIMLGRCRPTMAMAKAPVLVGGVLGHTEGPGPFADIMRFAKSHEGQPGVLSTSAFLVHPYLDLPDMGGGGLVVTDNDPDKAARLAAEIAQQYWERRFDLDPEVLTPEQAIAHGLRIAGGPVLLVETADCCGGGAAGDSVATLKALLAATVCWSGDQPTTRDQHTTRTAALVPVVDPEAASHCRQAGVGREVTITLGHQLDSRWGQPIEVTGVVEKLSDGSFLYTGGFWDGTWGQMGPTAVLRCDNVQVLITTHATYDWADEQFRSVGLDARQAKFVVVKNPMNYRLGYAGISAGAMILDTPGPTPAILHHVKYRRLQRPYYPADKDIANFSPTIYLCATP
jgi:microcystin degradation protein MlrC